MNFGSCSKISHQEKSNGLSSRLMVKKLLIWTDHMQSPIFFCHEDYAASNANCLILTILQLNRGL